MTVEDFILLCRLRRWFFTANWVEKRYKFIKRSITSEMSDHLKKRAHNI